MTASSHRPHRLLDRTQAVPVRHRSWRLAALSLPLVAATLLWCATPRLAQAQTQPLSPGLRLPAAPAAGTAAPRLSLYASSHWAAHLDLMATRSTLSVDLATGPRLAWQLLGDYRFGPGLQLRATGGLFGSLAGAERPWRSAATEPADTARAPAGWQTTNGAAGNPELRAALPYLGVGWDTSTRFRHGWGGWGLSADLGLTTQRTETAELRLGNSSRLLGDNLGSWRLTPLVQIGLSYAF